VSAALPPGDSPSTSILDLGRDQPLSVVSAALPPGDSPSTSILDLLSAHELSEEPVVSLPELYVSLSRTPQTTAVTPFRRPPPLKRIADLLGKHNPVSDVSEPNSSFSAKKRREQSVI